MHAAYMKKTLNTDQNPKLQQSDSDQRIRGVKLCFTDILRGGNTSLMCHLPHILVHNTYLFAELNKLENWCAIFCTDQMFCFYFYSNILKSAQCRGFCYLSFRKSTKCVFWPVTFRYDYLSYRYFCNYINPVLCKCPLQRPYSGDLPHCRVQIQHTWFYIHMQPLINWIKWSDLENSVGWDSSRTRSGHLWFEI